MKTGFVVIFFAFVFATTTFAQNKNPENNPAFPSAEAHKNSKLSYKIISSPHNTFGYDIYSDGKPLIHQPSIPGMPGIEGFENKAAAEKVAGLVVTKISNGQMPPVVTIDEMKKLKAIP